jgi:hypothetical protein
VNIKIGDIDPWAAVPAAILYGGIGALASGVVFNKLSHLVEYTLNKTFGDYENPEKMCDGRIVVTMPRYEASYYVQNIALAALVAAVSLIGVKILVAAGCPILVAIPLLVGSVAVPIIFSLCNMMLRYANAHRGRWVAISDAEVEKRGINKGTIEISDWGKMVYLNLGASPKFLPGGHNSDDW